MVEAGLLDAKDEKVADLEYWLENYGLFSGLPAFMANSIDPYYVYNQSLSQLLRGEHAKFVGRSTAFRPTQWHREPTRQSRSEHRDRL